MNIMDRPHVVVHQVVSANYPATIRIAHVFGPYSDGYAAREATTRFALKDRRDRHYYNFMPLDEEE